MQSERFFFVHLVKTAGTSLRKRLEHHFGESAVYPDASDADGTEYFSTRRLRERVQARGGEIRVVAGHFPLCAAEMLGGGFTTLTIVRDPVERVLSHLHHHRAWSPELRDKSLEEVYAEPRVFHHLMHNHVVKMFSLTPDEALVPAMLTRVEFTEERFDRAKDRLASVDAIGLHERIDEFFVELTARFGWDLGPPRHEMLVDPAAKSKSRAEVSDSFRSRLTEDNAMDIELYRFAQRLYDRRRADARGWVAG